MHPSHATRRRLEAAHLAFTLPDRLMRGLGTIVLVLASTVHHGRHGRAVRGGVAAELVGDPDKTGVRPGDGRAPGDHGRCCLVNGNRRISRSPRRTRHRLGCHGIADGVGVASQPPPWGLR
jgi:hypothetical protein